MLGTHAPCDLSCGHPVVLPECGNLIERWCVDQMRFQHERGLFVKQKTSEARIPVRYAVLGLLALAAFLGFLGQRPADATHQGTSFALCSPNWHANWNDINWHFSSTGGVAIPSSQQTLIKNTVIPRWNYVGDSNWHSHYDTSAPWHIIGHPSMALNIGGWVGTSSASYASCGGGGTPLPSSGDHLTASTMWINDDVNWYVSCAGTTGGLTDLCSVVLHEYGHMMGIDHTCGSGGHTVMCDTPITPGVIKRVLTHDDIRHNEELYSCHPPGSGGCK